MSSANDPVTRGSYGTIFLGQGKGHTGREPLQNNVNKLHAELHHKSVADAIQPKRPDSFNKYARQVGRLYGIGADSPVVAHALIAENYSESHPKDEGFIGVRRSALEMVLEGEGIDESPGKAGMNDGAKNKKGDITREFPTEETKSISSFDRFGDVSPVQAKGPKSKHKPDVWNKKGAQPLTITESLYLSERMEGGQWHIDADKKKDDYTAPMVGAAAGELGNSITTTPKSWPKSVEYTKSISRPHPELEERFQKGVADKACSKSRLGSMRAFNRANSGSIYDTSSGFINPSTGKKTGSGVSGGKAAKGKKGPKGKQQQQYGYPRGQGPVDDASVLSFEASYAGNGQDGHFFLEEEDSFTLDGGSVGSPGGRGGAQAGGTGGGYKVSFDGDLYEGEQRRDRNVLSGLPDSSPDGKPKGAQGQGVPSEEHKDRAPLVLENDQDIDEYLSSQLTDPADVLGDIAVDEIYSKRDSDKIAITGVGRANTAGESPPRKPQPQPQPQPQALRHSQMHHSDFDERSVLTDSESVHFLGGSIDKSGGASGKGAGSSGSGVGKGRERQRGSKDRVFAVDYGDNREGIVVPGSREGGRRRGGISVGPRSSPTAASDHHHHHHHGGDGYYYADDGSSIASEGAAAAGGGEGGGASWINAVGADRPVQGGRVVGYEYRREKYDEEGRPVERAYHHTEIDDNDTDEHSVGSYRSLNSLPYPRSSDHHHHHHHSSQSVLSEMTGARFNSRDLVCGKLEVVERNSATRIELEKSVRRGVNQAHKTVTGHASMLLAGPGGAKAKGGPLTEAERTRPEGAYVDDATIATAGSLELSTHQDLLLNIPGNISTGDSVAGSDTISRVKHALGKKESAHNLERGGEHALPPDHAAHKRDVAGLGNTAAGRFKMRFDDAPAAAAAAANAAAGWGGDELTGPTHGGGSPVSRSSPSHVREKKHFNASQPEHLRWSKLAGQGMDGQAGKPDLESRRQKIAQMHEEKRRQRRAAKQTRKHRRQEDAEARWHAKMVEKKKARLAQGLGSDDEDEDEEWSDEEVVVTSDEDEEELEEEERAFQESLAKAELSALPHDNRYDKQGNLIMTNKMTVTSLIGKGPATGEEGSPGARERNKQNVASRRKRGTDAGGKPLPGSDVTFYNPENNRSYADHLNEHLEVPTEKISGNPFRPTQRQIGRSGAKSVTRIPVPKDTNPLDYKAESTHRKAGRYGIIIKADKTTKGGVPSRNEIQTALSKASRKNLLAYDTRIVETGTLLKAVNHHQHACPGIPAIVDLHKAFVTAAAMNPNPWLLKRDQVASVLQEELPWLDGGSLRRLVSAYDPHGTGLIKYVKLSTALVCASKPAMANLIVLLSRIEEERQEKARQRLEEGKNWDLQQAAADSAKANAQRRYKHTSTDSHSHLHDPGTEPLPSGKPRDDGTDLSSVGTYAGDYGSEKYLLQLVHGLYEDCEGTNTGRVLTNNDRLLPPRTLAAAGCGMRIADLIEAVSSCACNVEDELVMQSAMAPVVQAVYQEGRAKDSVLSAYDEEQRLLEEERRAEQTMIEREAQMRELNAGKGGGDPHADDMSSNFTARSGFTPGHIGGVGGGSRTSTARGSSIYDAGNKRAAAGSRYGDGYQPRWPEHSRGGSTSMVRDPQDRFSGTGMHGASAKQVTKFMNRSRASEEEAALWMKGKEGDGYRRKQHQGGPRGSVVRGGDSIAWDDESLAASSLASAGAVTTAAGGAGGLKKAIRGGRRANTGQSSNRGTASTAASDYGASKYLPDGRLAAAHALKHESIKNSMHVPRVEQATFVSCMVDNSVAIETFVHQLDKFRRALEPYIIGGTVSYEQSVLEETSYGSRLPHRNSAMR